MEKRRMCPHCRAFITTSDRTCPYCNEVVGPSAVQVRDPGPIAGLIPAARFTTSIILLLNIGIYIAAGFDERLKLLGEKDRVAIFVYHEWWRLITAGFFHVNLIHIGMNMWVLNDLGAEVERTYGTARFLVIYFLSTVSGYLLSAYLLRSPSVGASAGLMGLIGAMIAFGVKNRTTVGRQIRAFYIKWAVYTGVMGLVLIGVVDNFAHLGGIIGGFAVAYVAGTPVHSSRFTERFWRLFALICILITAFGFWQIYQEFSQLPPVIARPEV